MNASEISADVYPIFAFERGKSPRKAPIAVLGTGFLVAPDLFLTCWHTVRDAVEKGYEVALVASKPNGGKMAINLDPSQDERGLDLASARLVGLPQYPYSLAPENTYGQRVWSFGYPLTEIPDERNPNYRLAGRYLEGYVVRTAADENGFPIYELDMRAPAGMSGAPISRVGTRELIGVVERTKSTGHIEVLASVDAEGNRTPEVEWVEYFALGHTVGVLAEHRSAATGGAALRDLMP